MAHVLNKLEYGGHANWNIVDVVALIVFRGSFSGTGDVLASLFSTSLGDMRACYTGLTPGCLVLPVARLWNWGLFVIALPLASLILGWMVAVRNPATLPTGMPTPRGTRGARGTTDRQGAVRRHPGGVAGDLRSFGWVLPCCDVRSSHHLARCLSEIECRPVPPWPRARAARHGRAYALYRSYSN